MYGCCRGRFAWGCFAVAEDSEIETDGPAAVPSSTFGHGLFYTVGSVGRLLYLT